MIRRFYNQPARYLHIHMRMHATFRTRSKECAEVWVECLRMRLGALSKHGVTSVYGGHVTLRLTEDCAQTHITEIYMHVHRSCWVVPLQGFTLFADLVADGVHGGTLLRTTGDQSIKGRRSSTVPFGTRSHGYAADAWQQELEALYTLYKMHSMWALSPCGIKDKLMDQG